MSNKFKKGDFVALITGPSMLGIQTVTTCSDSTVSTMYLDCYPTGQSARTVNDFVSYRDLVLHCLSSDIMIDATDLRKIKRYKQLHSGLYHRLVVNNLAAMSLFDLRKFMQSIYEDVIDTHQFKEFYEHVLQKKRVSVASQQTILDNLERMPQKQTQTQTQETDTMPKLYKIIKTDDGKAIKKPTDFGEYIATDGEFLMLKMSGTASDKPMVQAFKPDQVEEVLPWTFQVKKGNATQTFTAKKDSVKVGDVLINNDQCIFVVSKVNTKVPNIDQTFTGRRVTTEALDT